MITLVEPVIYVITLIFSAHIFGDFVFQTRKDVERKPDLSVLIKHSLVHAALAYVFSGMWSLWIIPVVIFISHGLIDWIKDSLQNTIKKPLAVFLLDQAAHIVVIIMLAFSLNEYPHQDLQIYWIEKLGSSFFYSMVIVVGIILVVRVGGIIIKMASSTDKHREDEVRR